MLGVVIAVSFGAILLGSILVATGVGAPVGVVLIGAGIGGLIGLAGIVIAQGASSGWDNINGSQVALNGGEGIAMGALMTSPLGAVSTGFAVGGKFLSNNPLLMNKFVNNSSAVKSLGDQSLELDLFGRCTYMAYWKNVTIMQTIYKTGVSAGLNLLRGGSRNLINILW